MAEEQGQETLKVEPVATAEDDAIGTFSFVGGSEHDTSVAIQLRSRKSRAKSR